MKYLCRCAALFLAAASLALPAAMSIGVVSAIGSYAVNDALAEGPTALSDGSRLQTTISPSQVMLANGVDVTLATRSSGRVFADHVVLENGAVKVSRFDGDFSVNVRSLAVQSESPESQAIVRTHGNTVEVASLGGTLRVSDGVRLVRVAAGTKTSFSNADQGAGQTQTGAKPAPAPDEADTHALEWSIVAIAGAAVIFGSVAAYQGKNPF